MRHTVCLTEVIARREPDGDLSEMIPHCPTCGKDVPVEELTNGLTRSEWEWNGMDPNDLMPRKIDPLNSAMVIFFLLAGGAAFVLGAWQSGIAGLPEVVAGAVCWAVAWHFKQLGRLY